MTASESGVPPPEGFPGAPAASATGPDAVGVARDIALVAVFAGLTVVLSVVPLTAIGPVPLTLQTLAVMLCGLVLGPRRAVAAVAVYLTLGLAGLPVFAGGAGGLGVLAGPTGGFLLGFLPGALVTGLVTVLALRRTRGRLPLLLSAAVLGGVVVVYLVGWTWLAVVTQSGVRETLVLAASFVPGDLLKALAAAFVAASVHRAFPDLLTRR